MVTTKTIPIDKWNVNVYKETCNWICSRCQRDNSEELCRGFLTCMDGNVYKVGCKNMIPKKGLVKDGEFYTQGVAMGITSEKKLYLEHTQSYTQHLYDTVVVPFMEKNNINEIDSVNGCEIFYGEDGRDMEEECGRNLSVELRDALYPHVENTPLEDTDYLSWVINETQL